MADEWDWTGGQAVTETTGVPDEWDWTGGQAVTETPGQDPSFWDGVKDVGGYLYDKGGNFLGAAADFAKNNPGLVGMGIGAIAGATDGPKEQNTATTSVGTGTSKNDSNSSSDTQATNSNQSDTQSQGLTDNTSIGQNFNTNNSSTANTALGSSNTSSTGTSHTKGTSTTNSQSTSKVSLPEWYEQATQRAIAIGEALPDYESFVNEKGALFANTDLDPYMNKYTDAVWNPQANRLKEDQAAEYNKLMAQGGANSWGTRGALVQNLTKERQDKGYNEAMNKVYSDAFGSASNLAQQDIERRWKDKMNQYESPFKAYNALIGGLGTIKTGSTTDTSGSSTTNTDSTTDSISNTVGNTFNTSMGNSLSDSMGTSFQTALGSQANSSGTQGFGESSSQNTGQQSSVGSTSQNNQGTNKTITPGMSVGEGALAGLSIGTGLGKKP